MKSFKSQRLAALSRQGRFQFLTVVAILAVGVVLSVGLGWNVEAPVALEELIKEPRVEAPKPEIKSRADFLTTISEARKFRKDYRDSAMPTLFGDWSVFMPLEIGPASELLRPAEATAMKTYLRAMLPGNDVTEKTLTVMETAAKADPASGLIASMQGDLLRMMEKHEEALTAYERGADEPETGSDARVRALLLCVRRQWQERLAALYEKPGWRESVRDADSSERKDSHDIMVAAGDWTGLLWQNVDHIRDGFSKPAWLTIALACGVVWFVLIHMAGGIILRRWWLGVAGVALGVLSIPLTLFFSTLQHHFFGIDQTDDRLNNIFYCISGIGLPEELAKLLLFMPLLPFLRGKTTLVHVLAAASCVGLGFAVEENVNYFASSSGTSFFGRFITANFIHLALTGLSGTALWLAVRSPGKWLQHFTVVFTGAVCFHGLWDWSPTDARFVGDVQYFKFAGLIGLALYYFKELQRFRGIVPGVPSPAWVFLTGISLLTALVMCVLSSIMGFRLGFALTMQGALGLFLVTAAMYYQLRRE